MCQGFVNLSGFVHHFVFAKLATSSIRVNRLLEIWAVPMETSSEMIKFTWAFLMKDIVVCFSLRFLR